MLEHTVPRLPSGLRLATAWNDALWRAVPALSVDRFHANSSDHRPITEVKVAHDGESVWLHFRVQDRYLTCTRTAYQSAVCKDACVEFFVQPRPDRGYFNFEFNCAGTMLLGYHQRPQLDAGPERCDVAPAIDEVGEIEIAPSIPAPFAGEIQTPTTWFLSARIPVTILERYVGGLRPLADSAWRANFYKCAGDSSHPHWASWSPIGEELTFHNPRTFGTLHFAA